MSNKSLGNLKHRKLSLIHPNPWNPNVQDAHEFEAVKSGLIAYGQVSPLVVRTHPIKEGEFELIDGEHRLRAMKAVGLKSGDVYDLGLIPDSRAKKLTIVLGEARGSNDALKLGTLLKDLMQDIDDAELIAGLPQTMDEIRDLVDLSDYEWDASAQNSGRKIPAGSGAGSTAADADEEKEGPPETPAEDPSVGHDPQTYVFGPYYVMPEQGKPIREMINAEKKQENAPSESVIFANLMLGNAD